MYMYRLVTSVAVLAIRPEIVGLGLVPDAMDSYHSMQGANIPTYQAA